MRPSHVSFALTGCQPRTLASLLDLQECSYRRLRRLAPELEHMQERSVSSVAGSLDLHLHIVERFKYTTTLLLTYRFPAPEGPILEPNLLLRLYHDARLAEPLSHSRRHRPRFATCRRRSEPTELESRWEANRFLQRWLGYCLHQGHLFLHCTASRDRIACSLDAG